MPDNVDDLAECHADNDRKQELREHFEITLFVL